MSIVRVQPPSRSREPLIGILVLLPLLAIAVVFGLALNDSLRQYRAADEARLQDTARTLATAVDARLGAFLGVVETLARSGLIDDVDNTDAFAASAGRVAAGLSGWFVLVGPGPEHMVLATTLNEPTGKQVGPIPEPTRSILRPVLERVFNSGQATVSDLFVGGVVRQAIMTVMAPVRQAGTVQAGLSLSFGPDLFLDLLRRHELPAGTFAAIADGRSRIVAHSRAEGDNLVGVEAPAWIVQAMTGRASALLTGPGLHGEVNTYAIERPLLAPGWTVVVAQPIGEQQASAWRALRWLLAGGAALVIGVAAAAWASRRAALRDARREAAALRAGRAEVERLHAGLPAIIYLREVSPAGISRKLYRGGDFEAVLGWPAGTFEGADSLREWLEPGWGGIDALMVRAVAEGHVSIENRLRQPDGSWRLLRTHCRLLARQPDGTAEVVGYMLDATAERDAQARAMAAARLASLGEMAGGLAHEVRQPLQSISLAAELVQLALARGDLPGAHERLERVVEHTQRTSDLIERLRRFARGAEPGAPLEVVPLDQAVHGALDMAHSALRDAGIQVELALGTPAPAVLAHAVLLEQVLSNLLLNARDALLDQPATRPRHIRIAAEQVPDGKVRLTIADTGGGLAPEVLARLFEPFVTTKLAEKGTGLGLSICFGLVKGMGGNIEGRNEGEGAVFAITLAEAKTGGASASASRTADEALRS